MTHPRSYWYQNAQPYVYHGNVVCLGSGVTDQEHKQYFYRKVTHYVSWIACNPYINVVTKRKLYNSDQYDLRCIEQRHLSWDHDE